MKNGTTILSTILKHSKISLLLNKFEFTSEGKNEVYRIWKALS
jgi:hypothetical protein